MPHQKPICLSIALKELNKLKICFKERLTVNKNNIIRNKISFYKIDILNYFINLFIMFGFI